MDLLVGAVWLLVLVPVALAALIVFVGRVRPLAPLVASLGPLLTLATGLAALGDVLRSAEGSDLTGALSSGSTAWFAPGTPSVVEGLGLGWSLDGLAALMLVVVGTVALAVVIFSVGYMAGDRGWARYFALLSFFVGSMNLLVVADSFTTLFIGWELVGVCSYLLIGFWFEKPSAARAAIKAFLTTRVGDVGLLLGLAVLWSAVGSLSYGDVFAAVDLLPATTVTAAAVLIAIGAIGKSAQFPLHFWLPDAMEGPTPVSALIHAATMVAAGVYLIARTWPVFESSQTAQSVLLIVGVASALIAGTAAVPQRDIKRVLAYSTISQLGFMFAALGVGAWVVAMFHLVAHASFKALLFLCSGSVIHGSGTQDMYDMGGLRKTMPVTTAAWIVGAGALAGLPPLAGFFSKDEIITSVLASSPIAGAVLVLAAGVTAFYITRATRLAFFGRYRGDGHPHESPPSMLVPLVALAIPSATLGFAGATVARALGEPAEHTVLWVAALSTAVAVAGVLAGWFALRGDVDSDKRLAASGGSLWRAAADGWHWDALVQKGIVEPTQVASRWIWAFVDRMIIDGAAEGTAGLSRRSADALARMQSGDGQWYVALLAIGAAALMVVAAVSLR
jgi:NADH-quinone oxidoreductase subunit L